MKMRSTIVVEEDIPRLIRKGVVANELWDAAIAVAADLPISLTIGGKELIVWTPDDEDPDEGTVVDIPAHDEKTDDLRELIFRVALIYHQKRLEVDHVPEPEQRLLRGAVLHALRLEDTKDDAPVVVELNGWAEFGWSQEVLLTVKWLAAAIHVELTHE